MKILIAAIFFLFTASCNAAEVSGWILDTYNGQLVGVGMFPLEIEINGRIMKTSTNHDGWFRVTCAKNSIITLIRHTGDPCLLNITTNMPPADCMRLHITPQTP